MQFMAPVCADSLITDRNATGVEKLNTEYVRSSVVCLMSWVSVVTSVLFFSFNVYSDVYFHTFSVISRH